MSSSFGCAGVGYVLSVYDKKFNNRDEAFTAALNDLKLKMSSKIGSSDTTNNKQLIILATLRDIENAKVGMVWINHTRLTPFGQFQNGHL